MADFLNYLKSKVFFIHLTLAVVSLSIVLWILFTLLGSYTHHGETAEVPDFNGKDISELEKFVSDKKVGFVIIDSVYDPKEKPGIVIKQEPEAKSLVKHNRIIYLYVTSLQPPKMEMPKLVDKSTRQALFMLESYGLALGKITEIAGDCKGCVLKQFYDGNEIMPGDLIRKGSKIDLHIGKTEDDYAKANSDSTAVIDPEGE
jgi:eukaryotic-like serine/threonine-protein kinase